MDPSQISNTDIWTGVATWFVTIFQIVLNSLVLVFSTGMTQVFTALFGAFTGGTSSGT